MAGAGSEARLRLDLREILDAALAAVDPEGLVRRALAEGEAAWPGPSGPAGSQGGLVAVAVGKAAPGMARGAGRALGRAIGEGVLLAPAPEGETPAAPPGWRARRGGHPLPDPDGMAGAREILERVERAGADTPLLLLVSGGGSALLTLPARGLGLDDVGAVTRRLQEAGADIGALNTVRKHLDRVKGGRLARAAAPAPVLGLLLSDVVGDPPEVIASGPVSPDPTTYAGALDVLDRHLDGARVPSAVRRHLEAGARGDLAETPGPGDPCFASVTTRIVGSAATALEAAARAARERGYGVRVLGADVTGEAREVGRRLGGLAVDVRRGAEGPAPPACVLSAGETTVRVTGDGVGGRNQEVALGAARTVDGLEGVLVGSAGTDGIDGPTDAAGALVTGSTVERARGRGLDPDGALERNDADSFFRALDDRIVTGPTGTNVMDMQIVLVGDV